MSRLLDSNRNYHLNGFHKDIVSQRIASSGIDLSANNLSITNMTLPTELLYYDNMIATAVFHNNI